jgi:hypothetical protein
LPNKEKKMTLEVMTTPHLPAKCMKFIEAEDVLDKIKVL